MNTMDDLRRELFETISALREGKTDVSTAKAISELSQTVINTAKAEAEYARSTGLVVSSGLIAVAEAVPAAPNVKAAPLKDLVRFATTNGYAETQNGVTRHTLK